jgi:uncharacterized membrane protein
MLKRQWFLISVVIFMSMIFLNLILAQADEEKKQIRVVVEGVDEEKTGETKPYILWEKYDKKAEEKKLKNIAQKSKMEQEILDALIGKIVDMEGEINNLKKQFLLIYFIFAIILVLIFIKKKKGGN